MIILAAIVAVAVSSWNYANRQSYEIRIGGIVMSVPFQQDGRRTQIDMINRIMPIILALPVGNSTPEILFKTVECHDELIPIPPSGIQCKMTVTNELGKFSIKRETEDSIGIYFVNDRLKTKRRLETETKASPEEIRKLLESTVLRLEIIESNFMPKPKIKA